MASEHSPNAPSRSRRWRRLGVLSGAFLAVFGYGRVAGRMEARRAEEVLPNAKAPAPAAALLGPQALEDLRTLSAPELEGRKVGTEGGRKARAWVARRFGEIGLLAFRPGYLHPFTFHHKRWSALWHRDRTFDNLYDDAANVLGYVKGRTRPDRWIVLSAHYDHVGVNHGIVYPGADDNASGVAAILAVGRSLVADPPDSSVILAAFDAEELGLYGAYTFVKDPPVPLERIAVDINLDMVSRSPGADLVVAGTHPHPELLPMVRAAAAASPVRVHLTHDRPFLRAGWFGNWTDSSDQGAFADAGRPWLYVGVEDHEDYHEPTDTFDRIDRPFFVDVTGFTADLVRRVAAAR